MPFQPVRAHPFLERSILAHAPSQSGVYGVSNRDKWIYIGETDDIRSALLSLLQPGSNDLSRFQPTGFCCELSAPSDRAVRQDMLIREYAPICNQTPQQYGSSAAGNSLRRMRP